MENLNSLYYIRKLELFFNKKQFRGNGFILKILKFLKPKPRSGMMVKTLYGFNLYIDPIFDKGIEKSLYDYGTYERGTLWCFKHLIKPGDIVFDAGANIGLTSIYASTLTGEKGIVFGFEPSKSTYEILKRNIKLNRIENVVPVNVALSSFNGNGYLYPNIHINRGAASLNRATVKQIPFKVEVKTLNSWMTENNILKLDFFKIDVEGSEFELLKGASDIFKSNSKPIICIEYSKEVISNGDIDNLYYLLKFELGYRLFKSKLGKEKVSILKEVNEEKDLPQHDNLYCIDSEKLKTLPSILFNDFK